MSNENFVDKKDNANYVKLAFIRKKLSTVQTVIEIENKKAKGGENSSACRSTKSKPTIIKFRKTNGIHCSQDHENANFCRHADGIIADCYVRGIVRNDLGPPLSISDYSISCDSEKSESKQVQVTIFHT